MAYKSILVNMGNPVGRQRGRIAAQLARAEGAELIGRHYSYGRRNPGPAPAEAADTATVASRQVVTETARASAEPASRDQQGRDAEDAERLFDEACQAVGVEGRFQALAGGERSLAANLLDEARCVDLTVLGKPGGSSQERDLVKELVAEAGGPVLVVPEAATVTPGTQHVLIAWNGTREAARAVRDALPLIERAGRATIVMVKPKPDTKASAERLKATIEAHGARCSVKHESGGIRASDSLISRAEESAADTLVMGAFGRARLQEMITGGATTGNLVEHATVPLLMSQ